MNEIDINFQSFLNYINSFCSNDEKIIKLPTFNLFIENMYFDYIDKLFSKCSNSVIQTHFNIIEINKVKSIKEINKIVKNVIEMNILTELFSFDHFNLFLTHKYFIGDFIEKCYHFNDILDLLNFIVINFK